MRPVRPCLIAFLLFFAGFAFSQAPPPPGANSRNPRVGVAVPRNATKFDLQPLWQQDYLVRFINRYGKKLGMEGVIEAVPVSGSSLQDIDDEARQKGCRYVILTTITMGPAAAPADTQHAPDGTGASGTADSSTILSISYQFKALNADDSKRESSGVEPLPTGGSVGPPTSSQYWGTLVSEALDKVGEKAIWKLKYYQ